MKSAHLPGFFGALLAASFSLLQCGGHEGDQVIGAGGADSGMDGSVGTAGTVAGAAGSGVGGASGSDATGAGGVGSSETGGGGSAETGGGGSQAGDGGSGGQTHPGDAAALPDVVMVTGSDANVAQCPLIAPVSSNLTCEAQGDTCAYPGEVCTCQRADGRGGNGGGPGPGGGGGGTGGSPGGQQGGGRRDGGFGFDGGIHAVWNCERVRDAGNPSNCPAVPPAKGTPCSMGVASFCRYMNANCACFQGKLDAGTEWNCN